MLFPITPRVLDAHPLLAIGKVGLAALLSLIIQLWGMSGLSAQAVDCQGSALTGIAFRDYNANGIRDPLEPGLGGIVVTVYDATGTTLSCTTNADGAYALDPLGAFPVRLEFTLPADGSLAFLKPGAAGSDSHTTVTFAKEPTTGINVGFNNPAHFCGTTPAPGLATSCFAFGEQNDNAVGVNKDSPVLYRFPYAAGSPNTRDSAAVRTPPPTQLAAAKELGAVWGLAWNAPRQTLYAAAFLKRHAGFGPHGPGAIYQITPTGVSLFYDFGALAGVDPHAQPDQTCTLPGRNLRNDNLNCWLYDVAAFDRVGKVGFGDIEVSEDFQTLFAVNLAANTLMAIPLDNPGAALSTPVPTPVNCPAADVRPFALAVNDGQVYLGMVCSAESTADSRNLHAYVYSFSKGSFTPTPVLDFALDYDRGDDNLQWAYWLNQHTFAGDDPRQRQGKWAQPWLTAITFDHDDMILGLRDRNGDQFGVVAGGPNVNDPRNYTAVSRGDLLRACATGQGRWQLEVNGACGDNTTAGADNAQGPGGGEYYFQDQHPTHHETSTGAHVQIPGLPDVAVLVHNPIDQPQETSDGGVKWYNNQQGVTTRSYLIYDGSGEVALFDKANGLGDLEALCAPAPLELGNRVWLDANGDGIQDPAEPGIGNVRVELYRNGVQVGTTTTDADGIYLFTNNTVSQNDPGGIVPGTSQADGLSAYEIRIPDITGVAQQPALVELRLSPNHNDASANGALRDSNGRPVGNDAIFPVPRTDLTGPGDNNHTYDFGFYPAVEDGEHPPVALVALGNVVFYDPNNNGRYEPALGERGINGIHLALYRADGEQTEPLSTTVTSAGGFYLFDNLLPGAYVVQVRPENFVPGALLADYRSSTGSGDDEEGDDNRDENGIDSATATTDGIRSRVYDLQLNREPIAESGMGHYPGLLDDAHVNYTVDFGFVLPTNSPTGLEQSRESRLRYFLPLVAR